MSDDTPRVTSRSSGRQLTGGALGSARAGFPPWEPNLIDWRHSLVQADKRGDAGDESLEICAWCGCEVDTVPQPHKPGCKGIGKPRVSSGPVLTPKADTKRTENGRVEGLDLLEAMDPLPRPTVDEEEELGLEEAAEADPAVSSSDDLDELDEGAEAERLGPDGAASSSSPEELEEPEGPPRVAEPGVTGAAPLVVREPVRAGGTSSTGNPFGLTKFGRGYIWTREAAVAAVQAFARDNNRAPRLRDADEAQTGTLPSLKSAKQLFGGWPALIAAAGLELDDVNKPRPGKRNPASDKGRRAKRQPASRSSTSSEAAKPEAANGRASGSTIDSSRKGAESRAAAAALREEEGPRSPTPLDGGRDDQHPASAAPLPGATGATKEQEPTADESGDVIAPASVAAARTREQSSRSEGAAAGWLAQLADGDYARDLIGAIEQEADRLTRRAGAFRKLAEAARELEETA